MELLDLELIGWLFSVFSGIALALGILIVVMHCSREGLSGYISKRVLEDSVLFFIWTLGLAGGTGVLLGKAWSRPALELFCWTLMVLLMMSSWSNLRAAPPPRNMRGIQLALFVLPVVAVCIATIVTLRSETALRVLAG
jgi:nitrogen fixation protein